MKRKLIVLAAAAAMAGGGVTFGLATAASAVGPTTGCAANSANTPSCTFTPDAASAGPQSGYVSATSGSYSIVATTNGSGCDITQGPDATVGNTGTNTAGTSTAAASFSNSGPGSGNLLFSATCSYTLTVSPGGNGGVAAGAPN